MKTDAAPVRPSPPLSTLKYRPKFSSVFYAVLVAVLLISAAVTRFRLPQVPVIDGDFWGYFNPVFSAMTGRGLQHTFGRDSLYPAFVFAVFKLGGGFRALCVVQHLLGLLTGVFMLAAWWRLCRLFNREDGKASRIYLFLGIMPTAAYLTAVVSIRFEHCIRPEAIFPLFVVLSIYLNLEFIQRRWIDPAPACAAWLGAAGMAVALAAYKLKPAFGFGLLLANLPLAVSLFTRGVTWRNKAAMTAGGGLFCLLALWLPEHFLAKRDPLNGLFVPDTLMTVHADQIRDQIAGDVAARRPTPFPEDQVKDLLDRLDTLLPISRLPENSPYPSLGFNPDYLLYTDCVYKGVTRNAPAGYARRMAMSYYFYRRTVLHQPLRMFNKFWRQMRLFYRFGGKEKGAFFGRKGARRGTKVALGKEYERNLLIYSHLKTENPLDQFAPMPGFLTASEESSHRQINIEQKPRMTFIRRLLETFYLPSLLLALLAGAWVLRQPHARAGFIPPVAATLLIFGYNLGNNVTISVVHSLDIGRYIDGQLAFTLFSSAAGWLLVAEILRRSALDLFGAPQNPVAAVDTSLLSPAPEYLMPSPFGQRTPPSLCVLIPCYNEVTSIAGVVAEYRAALPGARILVVDNASTDGTAAAAAAAGADVVFEPGKGKARAVLTALGHIDSDLVLMVDGDGSYPAEGGLRLYESYQKQPADLITGIRNPGEAPDGSFRRFHQEGTHLFGRVTGWVFGQHAADLFSGLRLFSRRFYENVPILSRGFELELELTVQAIVKGFITRDLPVPFGLRTAGTESKLRTVQDGSRILRLLFVLFRDYRPLWCFGILAGVFFTLGLLAGIAPIRDYVTMRYVLHLPLAVLAASLMVLAFLALQTGLMLESGLRHNREATQIRMRDRERQRNLSRG